MTQVQHYLAKGTEGGTGWDEHWVLCYMLANRTLIKNIPKKIESRKRLKKERERERERIMSSANEDNFTSSSLICILSLFLSCLIALARIYSSMLKRTDKNGDPCLVPDLRGKVSSFTIEYENSHGLVKTYVFFLF